MNILQKKSRPPKTNRPIFITTSIRSRENPEQDLTPITNPRDSLLISHQLTNELANTEYSQPSEFEKELASATSNAPAVAAQPESMEIDKSPQQNAQTTSKQPINTIIEEKEKSEKEKI